MIQLDWVVMILEVTLRSFGTPSTPNHSEGIFRFSRMSSSGKKIKIIFYGTVTYSIHSSME
jgi:hypothetical protein